MNNILCLRNSVINMKEYFLEQIDLTVQPVDDNLSTLLACLYFDFGANASGVFASESSTPSTNSAVVA